MCRWVVCGLAFLSSVSFAAFPTLICADAEKSLRFSEEADHFRLVYQGKNANQSLLEHLEDSPDGHEMELELRFAKKHNDAGDTPTCLFAADLPTVWSCAGVRTAEGLVITDKSTGASHSMRVTDLTLATQITHERAFETESEDRLSSTFQFRFIAVIGKRAMNMHTFHETEFAARDCNLEGGNALP